VVGLVIAAVTPRLEVGRTWSRGLLISGLVVTGTGVALRQWAIAALGRFFVGHVIVQPGQTVVSSGPYRHLRHPSYTGQWLEMVGIGIGTGNAFSMAMCALVPLIGLTARIAAEERELSADLPGYQGFTRDRPRLVPFIW
jgi:protein-S-isoprenylcysteine O-methyltransferase